ncbi:hypothetical protein GCM10020331_049050 [Ectobacillus funiculus]
MTKETIALAVGSSLVYNDDALRSIEEYYARTGRTFTENNKKQALVLEGSVVFPNDHGMAPGMGLRRDNKTYILLPGPPKEMRPMYDSYVEPFFTSPYLEGNLAFPCASLFFGIGESQLEETLQDLIDTQTNPTIAPLAAEGEVTLRLTAKHASKDEANRLIDNVERAILDRVGEFFYGYDQDSLQGKLVSLLKKNRNDAGICGKLNGWTVQ